MLQIYLFLYAILKRIFYLDKPINSSYKRGRFYIIQSFSSKVSKANCEKYIQ